MGCAAFFLTWVPSYLWFFAKLLAMIVIFIWVTWHFAPTAHGPTDELCVEVYVADGVYSILSLPASGTFCRRAFCDGLSALLVIVSICSVGARIDEWWKTWKSESIDLLNDRVFDSVLESMN